MKLLKLELEDYRRFEGKHEITFASGENQNVTIIQAQNGAGKTGILMALLFGLFGVVQYQEFNIETDNQDILVNRNALRNNSTAVAIVKVEFMNRDKHYKIQREIQGSNVSGRISQNADEIKSEMHIDGIKTSSSTDEINEIMNEKIGENIRGFLFFDGVKYMNLFQKDHNRYRKELQEIIERMLNIDDLDTTIKHLRALESSISSNDVSQKYAKRKTELLNEQKKLEKNIDEHKKQIQNLSSEIEQKKKQKTSIETKLENVEEYRSTLDSLRNVRNEKNNHENTMKEYINNIVGNTNSAVKSLMTEKIGKELLSDVDSIIAESRSFDKSLIESIIGSKKCICGTEISDHHVNHLNEILSDIDEGNRPNQDFIYILKKIHDEFHSSSDDVMKFQDMHAQWRKHVEKMDEYYYKINDLESSLPEDLKEFEKGVDEDQRNLGSISQLIDSRESDLNFVQKKLESNQSKMDDVEQKLEDVTASIAHESGKEAEYKFYHETRIELQELRNNYLIQAQKDISDKANEFFQQLLSEHDKKAFSRLNINENYRIEAYDQNDSEVFQQLSAGQKHLAAMAFTMGLTAVATEAINQYQFPLVMDTPFSNLDRANRRRLIQLMPQVVTQWTLTPMDTELSDNEIQAFEETGSVGEVYQLLKYGATSKIEKHGSISKLKGGGSIV